MDTEERVSLAYDKRLAPANGRPEAPPIGRRDPTLNVDVVFTSHDATLAALKRAGELARRLNARISLIVPQVTPFPCPLSSPPVLLDFSERRLTALAAQSPVDITVRLYLCRDKWETLRTVLRPRSLVVVGGRKRWWPTRETILAGKLRRAGHEVVFAETE